MFLRSRIDEEVWRVTEKGVEPGRSVGFLMVIEMALGSEEAEEDASFAEVGASFAAEEAGVTESGTTEEEAAAVGGTVADGVGLLAWGSWSRSAVLSFGWGEGLDEEGGALSEDDMLRGGGGGRQGDEAEGAGRRAQTVDRMKKRRRQGAEGNDASDDIEGRVGALLCGAPRCDKGRWPVQRVHVGKSVNTWRGAINSSARAERGRTRGAVYSESIDTSTITPGSMLIDVICLTMSVDERRSIRRLCTRISNRSHVLVPSPHGDLRVVIRIVLVGMRTGPFTRSSLSLAPRTRSEHTFSSALTSRLVSVMRMRCCSTGASNPGFFSGAAAAGATVDDILLLETCEWPAPAGARGWRDSGDVRLLFRSGDQHRVGWAALLCAVQTVALPPRAIRSQNARWRRRR